MIDFSNYCISASRALNYPTGNLIPRQSGQGNKHRGSGEWFQDVWAEKLIKKGQKPIQTVFTGMPSAGKSTELKRLAVELNKKTVKTHHVVHLFLIQNDFSSGTGIYNVDDLWNAIMRCHASEKIREYPNQLMNLLMFISKISLSLSSLLIPLMFCHTGLLLRNKNLWLRFGDFWSRIGRSQHTHHLDMQNNGSRTFKAITPSYNRFHDSARSVMSLVRNSSCFGKGGRRREQTNSARQPVLLHVFL